MSDKTTHPYQYTSVRQEAAIRIAVALVLNDRVFSSVQDYLNPEKAVAVMALRYADALLLQEYETRGDR